MPGGRFPSSCPTGFIDHYFVIAGDTMTIIAQRFGTSATALIAANMHIADPNQLFPGDVLCVPGFRQPLSCPPNFQNRYTVKEGDTMFTIAKQFGITEQQLIAANPQIPNPKVIFPFDELCVP
jgi:LysM repeat protein